MSAQDSDPLDFPSSDAGNEDAMHVDETPSPSRPPAGQALFLPGTPSARGTPGSVRSHTHGDDLSSDAGGVMSPGFMARRAVGMNTPRRRPDQPALFAPSKYIQYFSCLTLPLLEDVISTCVM